MKLTPIALRIRKRAVRKTNLMLTKRFSAPALVALVSLPGFLLGQRLRQGDFHVSLFLIPAMLAVVFVASMIMRQTD